VLHHPPRMAQVEGDSQVVLLRREPVPGHQEMVLAVRRDQEDARDHELVLTSPEPAWTEVRRLVTQDLPRRRREVLERALEVRRAIGRPRRLCERRQRLCPQRVDITLSHHAPMARCLFGSDHSCISDGDVASGFTEAYRLLGARVAMRSGLTVISTRGSVFQRAR
jgi:hypothetical protein